MILFSTPMVLLILALMCVLHWMPVYLKGIISKIAVYVNIALHILVMLPMLSRKFTIEEAVLVYMISVFAYTLMSFVHYKLSEKDAPAAKGSEEEEPILEGRGEESDISSDEKDSDDITDEDTDKDGRGDDV